MAENEKPYGFHQEIDALVSHARDLGRGDVITYAAIKEKAGIDKEDVSFSRVIARMKERVFDELQIVVGRAKPNLGYPLLTQNEQCDWGVAQDRRSAHALKKGAAAVAVLDADALSEDRRSIQSAFVTGAQRLLSMLEGQRRERRSLVTKTASLPRIN